MQNKKIVELLHEYFELGVAEGREGRNHDTEAGDAQRVLSEIEAEIATLSAPVKPAPSVAVNALRQAASDFMYLFIQDGHLTVQGLEDTDLIPAYEKLSAALSAQVQDAAGWQSMDTAPKDGTRILIWFVHPSAQFSRDPVAEGWAAAHEAYWTDHNRGGWTWHGLCGAPTLWQHLPAAPAKQEG